MESWFIYGISLDLDHAPIRYVGLTRRTLEYRLYEHLLEVRRGKPNPSYLWMSKYIDIGFRMVPLERITPGDEVSLNAREIYWIKFYRDLQGDLNSGTEFNILNVSDGGGGCVRTGVSHHLYQKGHLISGDLNPNYGNGYKISGNKNPCFGLMGEEHPAYGHKHSDEVKKRISESKIGKHNKGNHTRYHVKRGISKPETCVDCREELLQVT